jgi:Flp pilus assembly protein TadD
LALISHQEYERAVKELQVAVKEKPGSFAAHTALGVAYRLRGQLSAATEEFKSALGLNPRCADASLNLADIALDEKRYVAATNYVQQALAKSPPPPFAEPLEMDLGVAYFQNREYEKAAGVFKKLSASHPDSAQFHFDLANSYVHYDEWAKAPAEYKEVLRLEPKNDVARLSLAKAYLSRNQANESLPYLRDYIRNQPQDPEGYEIEGQAYRKLGRFAEAVTVLRRAVALNAKSYEAHYNLGLSLARLGETKEGIEQLREAARLKPEAPEPAYELGLLLSKQEGAQAGQSEFQKFQQVKEESQRSSRADTLNEQGNKAMREGRLRDAVEAYREALRLNPGDAPFHYNLSLAYSKLGDRAAEEAELAKAVQLDAKLDSASASP